MAVVPQPTCKKLLFWLWTVLDNGQAYQTFFKNIKVKERQFPDYKSLFSSVATMEGFSAT